KRSGRKTGTRSREEKPSLPPRLLKTENFAVLGRKAIDHLRLLRLHIQDLLPLRVFVRRRAGDKRGGLPAVLLPEGLPLCRRQKNREERAGIRMRRALRHARIVSGRDHRLDFVRVHDRRAGFLRRDDVAVGERRDAEYLTGLKPRI